MSYNHAYNHAPASEYLNNLETEADDLSQLASFGEVGAHSLLVAQYGYPPMALTDVGNLLSSWLSIDNHAAHQDTRDDQLSQIYLMGVMALCIQMAIFCRPLFGVDWDTLMPMSLDNAREHRSIKTVTAGGFSWHRQHNF